MFLLETVTPSVMGLADYLSTLGSVVTQVMTWTVNLLGTMTSNPILLVPFGVVAVFTSIKVLKKIF